MLTQSAYIGYLLSTSRNHIDAAQAVIRPTLSSLTEADLGRDLLVRMGERTVSTQFFLLASDPPTWGAPPIVKFLGSWPPIAR